MQVRIINPIEYPNWDDQIKGLDGATIFHTAAWAKVLSEAYGYRPTYFIALEDSQIVGCLPVMGIKSFITGRRGVSLPFTDECSAICKSSNNLDLIWQYTMEHGKKAKWKYVELRGEHPACETEEAYDTYYVHTIDLDGKEENLRSQFRNSTKRNIDKAIKSGVEIQKSCSLESVKAFYRLNCLTRKRHGLPPQPLNFFLKLHEHIISAGMGFVMSAISNNLVVAAAIFLHYKNLMFYKYGASNEGHQQLRANNLLMWEAIKSASRGGFNQFHFGRTEVRNSGLLQFKRGWGTTESSKKYYRYSIDNNDFYSNSPKLKSSYAFFEILPMPFLKLFGNILYRHVG